MRLQRTLGVLVLMMMTACSSAVVRSAKPPTPAQLTPVVGSVLSVPKPVVQTDGLWKLPYELELMNATDMPMTIESIEIRDPQRADTIVATLTRSDIEAQLAVPGAGKTATLAAAQNGVLMINVSFPNRDQVPQGLEHVMTVSTTSTKPNVPPRVVTRLAPTSVDHTPLLVIGPPLRGSGWIAAASCCDSYHRHAVLPVNGRRALAQRFAIDWMQVNGQQLIVTGDHTRNASYPQYGADILSVGDGVVVHVVDGLPDGIPGSFPAAVTLDTADGNSVIVDLGDGVFALYAHMQPGSIRVRVGDQVARGTVLGLLGNSGNSDAPHLHFHLMDGPSALGANGVPYVIDTFTVTGQAVSVDELETELKKPNEPIHLEPVAGTPRREKQLPADLAVVQFPD